MYYLRSWLSVCVIYQGGGSMPLDERLTGRLETLEFALIKPKINPKGLERRAGRGQCSNPDRVVM
jgi:hypothetical protein